MSWAVLGKRVVRGLDRLATRRALLCVGWGLFCVYAFPGYMSTDSVDQLVQARGAPLHDWYPPVMALIWRATDHVIAGPFPMLVVQSVAFLLGADALLRRAVAPRLAAGLAAAILVFPPVLTQMAVIWKDSQMAGFLLAGAGCLVSADRRWKLAGCGFLVLATAQRYNAPAATLPLVLCLWPAAGARLGRRAVALALVAWLAVIAIAFGANRALTEVKRYPWHGSVALFDISGMIRFAPRIDDDKLRALLAGVPGVPTASIQQRFHDRYSSRSWFGLVTGPERVLAEPVSAADREAVARAWGSLAAAYPRIYLRHRWAAWKEVLGASRAGPSGAVWDGFVENDSQILMTAHLASHAWLQAAWIGALRGIEGTLVFRAWAYLLVALALLALCRGQRIGFAILASGIGYELSLYIAAPSADYRYSHWMIACTVLGAALVFAARYRAGASGPSAASDLPGERPAP